MIRKRKKKNWRPNTIVVLINVILFGFENTTTSI